MRQLSLHVQSQLKDLAMLMRQRCVCESKAARLGEEKEGGRKRQQERGRGKKQKQKAGKEHWGRKLGEENEKG